MTSLTELVEKAGFSRARCVGNLFLRAEVFEVIPCRFNFPVAIEEKLSIDFGVGYNGVVVVVSGNHADIYEVSIGGLVTREVDFMVLVDIMLREEGYSKYEGAHPDIEFPEGTLVAYIKEGEKPKGIPLASPTREVVCIMPDGIQKFEIPADVLVEKVKLEYDIRASIVGALKWNLMIGEFAKEVKEESQITLDAVADEIAAEVSQLKPVLSGKEAIGYLRMLAVSEGYAPNMLVLPNIHSIE